MKLYGFWRSTCTWRVRIALGYKGIAHEYQPVNLAAGEQHSEEFARINPMRQVPVLELDDGTRLAQSMAILDYLEELHPSPPLLPGTPFERARLRQLAEIITSGIQPHQNTSTQAWVRDQLGADANQWVRHWVHQGLTVLETELALTAGRFSVGDRVTIVDLCLIPELAFARRFAVELATFPTLLRVESACEALEAFQKAHADAQQDKMRP